MNRDPKIFLEEYKKYLREKGYSESTVKIYAGRLQRFLENGFSVADLIGSVDQLIARYSKGGSDYREEDRGNTRCALMRLNDYILEPYLDTFRLSYSYHSVAWTPKNKTPIAYTLDGDRNISITYNLGAPVTRKVNIPDFQALLKLLLKNHWYLNQGTFSFLTAPMMFDAPSCRYDLELGSVSLHHGSDLFTDKAPTSLRTAFHALIDKICA